MGGWGREGGWEGEREVKEGGRRGVNESVSEGGGGMEAREDGREGRDGRTEGGGEGGRLGARVGRDGKERGGRERRDGWEGEEGGRVSLQLTPPFVQDILALLGIQPENGVVKVRSSPCDHAVGDRNLRGGRSPPALWERAICAVGDCDLRGGRWQS